MCVYVCARGVGRRVIGGVVGVVGVWVRGVGGGGLEVEVEVDAEDIVVEGVRKVEWELGRWRSLQVGGLERDGLGCFGSLSLT